MYVLNPIVASSNAASCLEEEGDLACYTHLMECRSNEQLRRLLPRHNISINIRRRDLHQKMAVGDCFVLSEGDVDVVCAAIAPGMDVEPVAISIINMLDGEVFYFLEESVDVPGFTDLLAKLPRDQASALSWSNFKEMLQSRSGNPS